jgi:predicted phage replisome organizer
MAEYNKERFYWLKLKRDFFKRHDIQIIEAMPNGKDYVLFYLKLMVESIDHEGELRFSDTIPYNEQMLSVVTNTNIDIVRSAIKLLTELGIVEVLDDKTLYLKEVKALIGSQTISAEKKQIQLQNRLEKQWGGQKVEKIPPEKELELELESLLKTLKNRDSIASVCEMCKNNPRFSEITDEVLESLAYAGSEIETLNFGDRTVCREDFERLITKPHGFDGNMLVETANAVMACKETIKDRRYYILGIIVNRFMR